jgi:hypothetical protein
VPFGTLSDRYYYDYLKDKERKKRRPRGIEEPGRGLTGSKN